MNNLKQNILRVLSANVLQLVSNTLIGFIVPIALSLEGYADLKTYTLYMSYAGVLHFGFVDGIYLKYGGKNKQDISLSSLKGEHNFLVIMQLFISIIIFLIAILSHDTILLLISISVLPINLLNFHRHFYQAVGDFKIYSKIMYIYSLTYTLLNVFLIFIIHTELFEPYCLAIFFGNVLALLFSEAIFHRKTREIKASYSKAIFSNLKTGFFLMLGNLAAVLFYAVDRWFVKIFFSTDSFSYYSFAVSMLNIVIVLLDSVSLTLYNIFAKREDKTQIKKYKQNILILGALASCAYFPLAFIVNSFISKYSPSLDIIAISFATFPLLFTVKAIYVNLYKSRKLEKRYSRIVIAMLCISALFNLVATFVWHSTEAIALATLFSIIVWYIVSSVDFSFLSPDRREITFLLITIPTFLFTTHLNSPLLGLAIYILVALISCKFILRVSPVHILKLTLIFP